MPQSLLGAALAAGASIVTPNNRLAREIALRFDAARVAAGERAWTPARVLPWSLWLASLWSGVLAANAAHGEALLDPVAARELWHAIVDDDSPSLLNARGAARHALDAWTTFHGWRAADETIAGGLAGGGGEDAHRFARWSDLYAARLRAHGAVDHAQLPDVLISECGQRWTAGVGRVLLYGFLTLSPQQQRLVAALREAGVVIDEAPLEGAPASIRQQVSCSSPSREIEQALAFARVRVIAQPAARVAIVVADLERRRDEIVALAEEILCPERLIALASDAPRPYEVSLGRPLASVPLVACALDLVALAVGDVDANAAAAALRAPFLPDASAQWTRRAAIERRWRDEGRRKVAWSDVVDALRRFDPDFATRCEALPPPPRGARLLRDWTRAWSDRLRAIGWPGTAPLGSEAWQAHEAWSATLAKYAAMGAVTGAVDGTSALRTLLALFADTTWAPEGAPARIRILGVLEAPGLRFDCAWLAGFDAHRWPPPTTANPLLPLAWQRARGVVGAHPDTALPRAAQLTRQLMAIADEVVASHSERIDDAPSAMSPLFVDWPRASIATEARPVRWSDALAPAVFERSRDDMAPPLSGAPALRGGAGLFESQSAYPFQAFARYRLRVDAWDDCPDGLSAKERGTVLHAVLTAFWDAVHDHATLVALDAAALTRHIAEAVEIGKSKLPRARWQALPPAIANAEARRLAATLDAWIAEGEMPRAPFRVRGHEQPVEFELEAIGVRARIDRIDELDAGGLAIIDYKSGFVPRPHRWFAPRPEGMQLAVYAHGLDAANVGPIRALAYAQVKAGEIDIGGLVDAPGLWAKLEVPVPKSRLPVTTFADARAHLDAALVALARDIRAGSAAVAPRDRAACQYCEQKPLCRIRTLDDAVAPAPSGDE